MLADTRMAPRKYNPRGRKQLWSLVEKSVPIAFDGEYIWIERVLWHTVEKKMYLDIRKYKELTTTMKLPDQTIELATKYVETGEGILLPIDCYFKLFEVGIKLGSKYLNNKE